MTAAQIFDRFFLFANMGEMNEAIKNNKATEIAKYKSGLPRSYIVQGDSGDYFLVGGNDGRLNHFDEPTWATPTKQNIIDIIARIIEQYGDTLPDFDIVYEGQIYTYESLQDKFDCNGPEPTGEYYQTILLDYKNLAQ